MSAVIAYFNAFVDGELDSFSTHAALIGVIAVAEISLGIGIWLESPRKKEFREWLGLTLVLGGCVISVIFTVLLLIFDEGISRGQKARIDAEQTVIQRQNKEIIALEKRLAPRSLTADEQTEVAKELAKYDGQQFQGAIASGLPDGRLLWESLYRALEAAHWDFVPPSSMGFGDPPADIPIAPEPDVVIFAPAGSETKVQSAAQALAEALKAVGIEAKAVAGSLGDNSRNPTLIAISIGVKTK